MVDIGIRRTLVAASSGAPSPVVRVYGAADMPTPSWNGAAVRVLSLADAGRSVWLARVEHDGSGWVFSGPSFAVTLSAVDSVSVVHDPTGVLPLAGDVVDVCRAGALVDVELRDGDTYRARVTGTDAHGGSHVELSPTMDNGGGASGTPDVAQLAPRWVALTDIACAFPVSDDDAASVTLADFRQAFDAWRSATERMDAAWSGVSGDVFGDTYPAGLPSFDELTASVARMVIGGTPAIPVAPRAPRAGERVVFMGSADRESLGAYITGGMTATVVGSDDDGVLVRPDDPTVRAALTDWDGCVAFTMDDGYDMALDLFDRDDMALTDAWSPLDVAAFAAWRVLAPLTDTVTS